MELNYFDTAVFAGNAEKESGRAVMHSGGIGSLRQERNNFRIVGVVFVGTEYSLRLANLFAERRFFPSLTYQEYPGISTC